MQTLVSTLLLATTLSGAVQPAPLDSTETPTGPERAVLYTAGQGRQRVLERRNHLGTGR
jgi:hypothetical protein